MNNTLYWRTSDGGTYVDSFIGDDYNGDGTAQNPYQSLGRAWRGSSDKPDTITCRGYFAEDMADGNHHAVIQETTMVLLFLMGQVSICYMDSDIQK